MADNDTDSQAPGSDEPESVPQSGLDYRYSQSQDQAQPEPEPAPRPQGQEPSPTPDPLKGEVYGRRTLFHYNYDGSRDTQDPGSTGFFGDPLNDPSTKGVAVPVDILEQSFGRFSVRNRDGTYSRLNTPEANQAVDRIRAARVMMQDSAGQTHAFPIVDIQGSYKNWHRVLDMTLGAAQEMGFKDDGYSGYTIKTGSGETVQVPESKSDKSPMSQFRQKMGAKGQGLSEDKVLAMAQEQFGAKMIPPKDFKKYMTDPNGIDLIKRAKEHPLSPIQYIKATVPALKNIPDQTLADTLYGRMHPDMVDPKTGKLDMDKASYAKFPIEDFRDLVMPHNAQAQNAMQLFDENSQFWRAARREGSAAGHTASAQMWDLPKNASQVGQWISHHVPPLLFGGPSAGDIFDQADKWIAKNSPLEGYWQGFINWTHGQAQAQAAAAQRDVKRAQIPEQAGGTAGIVGGMVGGTAVGTAAAMATTIFPGAPIKSAIAAASLIEGVSSMGEAAQKNQEDALLKGVEGAGMGALYRYMMDSPAGRLMTGFNVWLAGAGEDTASKLLRGEPVDWHIQVIRSAVDITSGVLMGGHEEPSMYRVGIEAEPAEFEEVPRIFATPPESRLDPEQSTFVKRKIDEAEVFKSNGRTDSASKAIDDGLSQANGQEVAKGVINLTQKVAAPKGTPQTSKPLTKPEQIALGHYYWGTNEKGSFKKQRESGAVYIGGEGEARRARIEARKKARAAEMGISWEEEKPAPGAQLPPEVEEVFRDNPEARARYDRLPPEDKEQYIKHAQSVARSYESTKPKTEDRIIAAAIRNQYTGEVYSGANHGDAWEKAGQIMNVDSGFLTKSGKFVPDYEAPIQSASQIPPGGIPLRPRESGAVINPAQELQDWFRNNWPKARAELAGLAEKIDEKTQGFRRWRLGLLGPQNLSEEAGTMATIARARTSESRLAKAAIPTDIAHDMHLDNVLRGSERVSRRISFFDKFSREQQKQMLIDHEEGRTTGDPVADYMLKFHDTVYGALKRVEEEAAIAYDARETYMFHALKNDKQREIFEKQYNNLSSADPRFAKHRELPTWRQVFEAKMEPVSYNPERLLQMRLQQSVDAVKKVMTLREAESVGIAFRTDTPDLGDEIKTQWGDPIRAPNKERYYVNPDAQLVLRNAWPSTSLYRHPLAGPVMKALSLSKGTSATWKLGWSLVHPKHILKMSLANTMSQLTRQAISGRLRGETFGREMTSLLSLGHTNIAEVEAWQGKRATSELSLEQKQNLYHALLAGLDFSMNEEREQQFGNTLREWFPRMIERVNPRVRDTIKAGYNIVSSQVMQKWIFQDVVPSQKFAAFLSMRDGLIAERPELLKDENRMELAGDLQKIRENIEARFGEMFYDNLLWDKSIKEVGTNALLSFGWQLGSIRVYAGGIKDMAILAKDLARLKFSKDNLTDQLIFMGWYTGLNMIEGAIITYVANKMLGGGGDPYPKGRDFLFPRIGKNAYGSDKRVNPVEYTRELATWDQYVKKEGGWLDPVAVLRGTGTIAKNKLNPVIATAERWLHENRNFYGQQITDPNDPSMQRNADTVKFLFTDLFAPISIQPMVQNQGSWVDAAWGAIGFPPAPPWTGRTDTENRIVDTYGRFDASLKTRESTERAAAFNDLRTAITDKDSERQTEAEQRLRGLNVSQDSITHIRQHPNDKLEHYLFKEIGKKHPEEQAKIYLQMSPEEQREYFRFMNKALRTKIHNASVTR